MSELEAHGAGCCCGGCGGLAPTDADVWDETPAYEPEATVGNGGDGYDGYDVPAPTAVEAVDVGGAYDRDVGGAYGETGYVDAPGVGTAYAAADAEPVPVAEPVVAAATDASAVHGEGVPYVTLGGEGPGYAIVDAGGTPVDHSTLYPTSAVVGGGDPYGGMTIVGPDGTPADPSLLAPTEAVLGAPDRTGSIEGALLGIQQQDQDRLEAERAIAMQRLAAGDPLAPIALGMIDGAHDHAIDNILVPTERELEQQRLAELDRQRREARGF